MTGNSEYIGMNDEQILGWLRQLLGEAFEISPERVVPEAQLFGELDLDSIDAVDLAIKLQERTGKRIKPEDFKTVRSVGDVIGTVKRMMAA
jgi:acyl carrier protein